MIDTLGNLTNIKLLDKITNCREMEDEIVKVFAHSPKWKPSIVDGKKINTWRIITLIIRFE